MRLFRVICEGVTTMADPERERSKPDTARIWRNVERAAANIPAWAQPYLNRAVRKAKESSSNGHRADDVAKTE